MEKYKIVIEKLFFFNQKKLSKFFFLPIIFCESCSQIFFIQLKFYEDSNKINIRSSTFKI